MTIWRISWDFIPSFVNLKIKRVMINTLCPRCGCAEENSLLSALDQWKSGISRFIVGSEIASKISVYITEFAVTKVRNLTLHSSSNLQQTYKRGWTSIHFDAAYELLGFRLASGIIVRNENREILASQAVIHSNIADPFTAEAY
ncbi:hypothetical protein Goklo_029553 [Gossypium klotzschianum]|nr:hypothetical protein [Gossypium klotzschianum]